MINASSPSISNRSSEEPFVTLDLENIYQEQLITSNALLTIIPARNKYEDVYSRIIFTKVNGTLKHLVFNMVKDKESEATEFSGKIYLTTLEGDYVNAYKIVNGNAVIRYENPQTQSENVQARNGEDCWGIVCGMEGDEVYLEGPGRGSNWFEDEEQVDWFDGDGGGGADWDYGSGDTGGSSPGETACGSGYVKDAYGNCVVVDVEITNNLTGKALCVYEKLIRSTINNHNIITETFLFFGDGNPFNSNLIYNLESIHALLRSHYVNGTNSFVDLFGEYMKEKKGSNDITHAIMRDNYIPAIANALKQFDNNRENPSFYESLAWDGLHQFLSQEEKDKIVNIKIKIRNQGLNCN